MFNPFDYEDRNLDEAISSAYADLRSHQADDDEYQTIVDQLSKLYTLKDQNAQFALESHKSDLQEEQERKPFYERVDPNTALTVAGNIFIGLAVIKYEQRGVISSKVMSFMKKI